MTNKKPKQLSGWKEISKYAGWSESQLRCLERKGLTINRKKVGGRNLVWADPKQIDAFLRAWQEGRVLENDDEIISRTSGSPSGAVLIFWSFIAFFSLLLAFQGHRWFIIERKPLPFEKVALQLDTMNILEKVTLVDKSNRVVREVWEKKHSHTLPLKYSTMQLKYTISPKTVERTPIYFQGFSSIYGDLEIIHTQEERKRYPLPLDTVLAENGTPFMDLSILTTAKWCDNQLFQGWILGVASFGDYLGCLIFLDFSFQEVARIYHSGWIHQTILNKDILIVTASLNARESFSEPYRAAIFSLNFKKVLAHRISQVLAFSKFTIPSVDRRQYYSLKNVPVLKPNKYFARTPVTLHDL